MPSSSLTRLLLFLIGLLGLLVQAGFANHHHHHNHNQQNHHDQSMDNVHAKHGGRHKNGDENSAIAHANNNNTLEQICSNRPNTRLHKCTSGYNECLPSCAIPEPDQERCFRTDDCTQRCLCHSGWVSELPNGAGQCVRVEDCDKKACDDPNAVPNRCIGSVKCLPTCENPRPSKHGCWTIIGDECSMHPLPRCMCKPGYVSLGGDGEGPCVRLAQCQRGRGKERKGGKGADDEGDAHEPAPPPPKEDEPEDQQIGGNAGRKAPKAACNDDPLKMLAHTCPNSDNCVPTCDYPDAIPECAAAADGSKGVGKCVPRCICRNGFVLENADDEAAKCLRVEECVKGRRRGGVEEGIGGGEGGGGDQEVEEGNGLQRVCGDPNAVLQKCHVPRKCLATCKNRKARKAKRCAAAYDEELCPFAPDSPHCVCRRGYVSRNEDGTGPCVKVKECQKEEKEDGGGHEGKKKKKSGNNDENGGDGRQLDGPPLPSAAPNDDFDEGKEEEEEEN